MGVVRIRATMAAPVVMTDDLHLDGLLAAAHPMCRKNAIDHSTPVEQLVEPPLPVYAQTASVGRVYCCTAAILPESARVTADHAVRRRDGEDIRQLAGSVHLGLGPGKNRMHVLPIVATPYVEWYAIGECKPLRQLVRRIAFLGSWRSAGYGRVQSWEAAYVPEMIPITVLVRDGVAQRHLPIEWCDWSESVSTGPIQTPYWHPARQHCSIVRAGTRCVTSPRIEELVDAAAQPDTLRAHKRRHHARRLARRADTDSRVPPEAGPFQGGD